MYVPFRTRIFGLTGVSREDIAPRMRVNRTDNSRGINMRVVESTTSVLHSNNRDASARSVPPRVVVMNADGSIPPNPIRALNNVYEGREERRKSALDKRVSKTTQNPRSTNNQPIRHETNNSCGEFESCHADQVCATKKGARTVKGIHRRPLTTKATLNYSSDASCEISSSDSSEDTESCSVDERCSKSDTMTLDESGTSSVTFSIGDDVCNANGHRGLSLQSIQMGLMM